MSSELELRWLKTAEMKGAARRFADFCKQDVKTQVDHVEFDMAVYQDAIKLVLSKLDHSLTLEKLTQRIASDQGDSLESTVSEEPADIFLQDSDEESV